MTFERTKVRIQGMKERERKSKSKIGHTKIWRAKKMRA